MASPLDQSYCLPRIPADPPPSCAEQWRLHVEQTRARAIESTERQQALAEALRLLAGAREGSGDELL